MTINPCSVASYASIQMQPDMYYVLGDPTLTEGTYFFEDQPNNCGYEQVTVITGDTSFSTHDETNREFTIPQTFDYSLVGEYPFQITSTIKVWDDYTKTTFTEHEAI